MAANPSARVSPIAKFVSSQARSTLCDDEPARKLAAARREQLNEPYQHAGAGDGDKGCSVENSWRGLAASKGAFSCFAS